MINNLTAGYARVSTSGQKEDGLSIETQVALITQKAMEQSLSLTEIYIDEGKSGTTKNRPSFNRLIKDAESKKFSKLILLDSDRLSRKAKDYMDLREKFSDLGIELIGINYDFKLNNSGDILKDQIKAVFDGYFPLVVAEKTKQVIAEKVKEGWYPGECPVGYVNIQNPNSTSKYDKRIIGQDSERAPKVTRLFELYATGQYSIDDLVEEAKVISLNTKGKNQIPLPRNTIDNILHNPFYYGFFRWGNEEHLGKHKPLISKQLFDTCQKIREQRNLYANRERKYFFTLRGMLICSNCGDKVTAEHHKIESTGQIISYYHCCKRKEVECDNNYIEVSVYEKAVADVLKNYKFSDNLINKLELKAESILRTKRDYQLEREGSLSARKRELEKQRNTLEMNLTKGIVDDDTYKRQHSRITSGLNSVYKTEIELNQTRFNDSNKVADILRLARDINGSYNKAIPTLKKQYLSLFYKEIRVYKGEIKELIYTDIMKNLIDLGEVIISNSWGGLPGSNR